MKGFLCYNGKTITDVIRSKKHLQSSKKIATTTKNGGLVICLYFFIF